MIKQKLSYKVSLYLLVSTYKLNNTMNESYKTAGVDIEAGDEFVKNIKSLAKSTFNKNVLSGIGHFGAFYEPDFSGFKNPVLVSSVDGVGTKLKVAISYDRHDTIGQDLVNHCVNDIAVCGAKPMYFMDYLAFAKLDQKIALPIMKGFAKACRENGIALIGGETAEMPGFYNPGEYDVSGMIVGIVEKSKIFDGSKIRKGDRLIGFSSNGLHTNGFSLARKVLLDKFPLTHRFATLNSELGVELLNVHKSYYKLISLLADKPYIRGFSHITGGGIVGNTNRILPDGLSIKINWDAWHLPEIFRLIQETGNIKDAEMRKVFNMGIGLVAVVSPEGVEEIDKHLISINERSILIGEVI